MSRALRTVRTARQGVEHHAMIRREMEKRMSNIREALQVLDTRGK